MSLVYTSLLSLAPLLAVSFSILKGFGVHNQIEPMLLNWLSPLGEKGQEITRNIISFVENIQVGVLGFIGFLMLFYTVVSLIGQIEASFNHIWRICRPRSLYRRFSDYLSALLIGPVLLFSALGIMASMENSALVQRLVTLEPFGTVYYTLGLLLPYVLLALAFTFIYTFLPNTKVQTKAALWGGLITGVIWKLSGMLFAEFIADSAQYSAIYSGFAVILVAMIWLYLNWLILLLGGALVFHFQYPRYLKLTTRHPHLAIQCQEQTALLLMSMIGRQHTQGGPPYPLQTLAEHVDLPWESVLELLNCLSDNGFITLLQDEAQSYVLAHDTDAILLKDIIGSLRAKGQQTTIAPQHQAMQTIFEQLNQAPANTLKNKSLRDIL